MRRSSREGTQIRRGRLPRTLPEATPAVNRCRRRVARRHRAMSRMPGHRADSIPAPLDVRVRLVVVRHAEAVAQVRVGRPPSSRACHQSRRHSHAFPRTSCMIHAFAAKRPTRVTPSGLPAQRLERRVGQGAPVGRIVPHATDGRLGLEEKAASPARPRRAAHHELLHRPGAPIRRAERPGGGMGPCRPGRARRLLDPTGLRAGERRSGAERGGLRGSPPRGRARARRSPGRPRARAGARGGARGRGPPPPRRPASWRGCRAPTSPARARRARRGP